MKKLEHKVSFEVGHNCKDFNCKWDKKDCRPDKPGYHGIHGMQIRFIVKGPKGAVQFLFSTDWIPFEYKGHMRTPLRVNQLGPEVHGLFPFPLDLGYHSYRPLYKGQTSIDGACSILDGKPCYYDGSSLNAYDAYATLVNAGEASLWEFLEEYYMSVFHNYKYPEVRNYTKSLRTKKKDDKTAKTDLG